MDPARPQYKPVVVEPLPQSNAGPNTFGIAKGKAHHINKLFFLVPGASLVITIIAVTFIFRSNSQQAVAPSPSPTPTLIPATPTPVPVPTANSFNNPLFAFSYPVEMTLVECEGGVYLLNEESAAAADVFCEDPFGAAISVEYSPDPFDLPGEAQTQSAAVVGGLQALKLEAEPQVFWSFISDNTNFLVTQNSPEYADVAKTVLGSFNLKKQDNTDDWLTFENTTYSYQVEYPPEWFVNAAESEDGTFGPKVEIRKDQDEYSLHNLIIDTSEQVDNPQLSASGIASSTQTLSGWGRRPALEYRNIGGGTALVLSGPFNGGWQTFVVVWYKTNLIQMSFKDNLDKLEQSTFDNIISSFEFTN